MKSIRACLECLVLFTVVVSIGIHFALIKLHQTFSVENENAHLFLPSKKRLNTNTNTETATKTLNANRNRNDGNRNGWSWATDEKPPSSPYAYSFVLGGIHEDRFAYKGFLYNILIAVQILRAQGSTADFVIWMRLSPDSKLAGANHKDEQKQTQKLPADADRWLRAMDVRVRLLDTLDHESYSQTVFDRFRLLSMTEYKRVIYLDADIMPRSNMDYLFRLSDTDTYNITDTENDNNNNNTILNKIDTTTDPLPVLRPNLILASRKEPCNGGMFMVAPNHGNYATLQAIIRRQREEGEQLKYPYFDYLKGWGHKFKKGGDRWYAVNEKDGDNWRFHGSHADQGLLYYYVKYANQDVSIVIGDRLLNYVPMDDGTVVSSNKGQPKLILDDFLLSTIQRKGLEGELPPTPLPKAQYGCGGANFKCRRLPYLHMVHFSGKDKPWQHGLNHTKKKSGWYPPATTWFQELQKLNTHLTMGLDTEHWMEKHADHMQDSPLGYLPKFNLNGKKKIQI